MGGLQGAAVGVKAATNWRDNFRQSTRVLSERDKWITLPVRFFLGL